MTRVALLCADLGNFRGNPAPHYVKQDIPEGWSLDLHFFDDQNFPPRGSLSPRLQAKIPKMLGYELAPGYDFYIWLDSSFILSDRHAVRWFVESCRDHHMVLFRHPHRNSIAEETDFIRRSIEEGNRYLTDRYSDEPIEEQVKLYLADQGFNDNSLYACGAFVYRKEMLQGMGNILPLWFYHNARYTIQDQLSLPYLVSMAQASGGSQVGVFSEGIFDNRYITFCDGTPGRDPRSNVGKWDNWYKDLTAQPGAFRYSDTVTYQLGADFLHDCRTVEDWGTGAGGFKRFRPDAIGVDGSNTPHAQKKNVDLVRYTSSCDAVFMRHVLEHNYDWKMILRNALQSATRKLCIVLFTPLNDRGTKEIAHNLMHGVDVPDLSLGRDELTAILEDFPLREVRTEQLSSATGYGLEYVLYIEK